MRRLDMTREGQFMMRCIPVTESGCWRWTGKIKPNGYGVFWWRKQERYAHRVAYELWKGSIAAGLRVDHLCRVRSCVNPDHLELVTPHTNVLRGVSLSAQNAKKTHCPRGHLY